MTPNPGSIPWERLALPPRHVPRAVQLRVRLAEFKKAVDWRTSLVAVLLFFCLLGGVVFSFLGALHLSGVPMKGAPDRAMHPGVNSLFMAMAIMGPFLLLAAPTMMLAIVGIRSNRKIHLLRTGSTFPATITKIWCSGVPFGWQPYESVVAEWNTYRKQAGSLMNEQLAKQGRHWPCKVAVTDESGLRHEINMQMDFNAQAKNPSVLVLCDPANVNEAIPVDDFYVGLTVSPDGHWAVVHSARSLLVVASFLRSAVPVVGTYLSAALGLVLFDTGIAADETMTDSQLTGAGVVLLFTLSHVLLPVFLFRYQLDFLSKFAALEQPSKQTRLVDAFRLFFRGIVGLFIGVWFALPIAALAWLTGWLTLLWVAVHLALAARGSRTWVFIEYGSTSMALLLFVACFSAERLFPLGIAAVLLQSLLLTVLDWRARKRWVSQEAEGHA